jgi:hypothetical protein
MAIKVSQPSQSPSARVYSSWLANEILNAVYMKSRPSSEIYNYLYRPNSASWTGYIILISEIQTFFVIFGVIEIQLLTRVIQSGSLSIYRNVLHEYTSYA